MGVRIVGNLSENCIDVGAYEARKIVHGAIQRENLPKPRA